MIRRTYYFCALLVMFFAACGPPIDDKKKSSFNNTDPANNENNATNGENNATNNVTSSNNINNPTNNGGNNVNNPTNNGGNNVNNPTNNATNNPTNNATNNPTNNDDGVEQTCIDFCELLTGDCVTSRCNLDAGTETERANWYAECTGVGSNSCQFRYRNEPAYKADVDEFVRNSCSSRDWNQVRCRNFGTDMCDCAEPTYGTTCTSDGDCDGGILSGFCATETADANPGGQCLAGGCWFPDNAVEDDLYTGPTTGCGEGGVCYVLDPSNFSGVCLASCGANSDCERNVTGPDQSGYSCTELGETSNGSFLGICQTACSSDADCGDQRVCTQDFACQLECTVDGDCGGSGFTCSGTSLDGASVCRYTG